MIRRFQLNLRALLGEANSRLCRAMQARAERNLGRQLTADESDQIWNTGAFISRRMRRPQFTVRGLLILMLTVACFFGGVRFVRDRRRAVEMAHREELILRRRAENEASAKHVKAHPGGLRATNAK